MRVITYRLVFSLIGLMVSTHAYAQFNKIDLEDWCAWSKKEIQSDVLVKRAIKKGIAINADHGVEVDPHLLYFTLRWLEERNIKSKFQFHYSAQSSPIKVRVDAQKLTFSHDAGERLISKK